MAEDAQNAVRELARAFYQVSGGNDVPIHVTRRLGFLLADQEVTFIDVALSENQTGDLGGQIVLFTADLVVVAKLTDVPDMRRRDGAGGRVDIWIAARTSLESIELNTGDGSGNSTADWRPDEWGSGIEWPSGGRLSLQYRGLQERVVIPRARGQYQDDVNGLLDGLRANLTE